MYIGCFFICALLLAITAGLNRMVQEESITTQVGHFSVGTMASDGVSMIHISLKDFTFSCQRNAGEQEVCDLVSWLERSLREIVMNAYSSERIAD